MVIQCMMLKSASFATETASLPGAKPTPVENGLDPSAFLRGHGTQGVVDMCPESLRCTKEVMRKVNGKCCYSRVYGMIYALKSTLYRKVSGEKSYLNTRQDTFVCLLGRFTPPYTTVVPPDFLHFSPPEVGVGETKETNLVLQKWGYRVSTGDIPQKANHLLSRWE